MTATLASLETRLKNYLSDSTSLVFSTSLIDEGLRLALGQLNLTLTQTYTISGLDGAGSTTLPSIQESLIIIGAAGYAAQSRLVKRSESFNLDQTVSNDLLLWSQSRMEDFKNGLDFLLNQAALAAEAAAQAARYAAETAKLSAESARITADQTRMTAQTAKYTAEKDRTAAQTAKLTADNAAAAAEPARLADLRGATVPPYPSRADAAVTGWPIDADDFAITHPAVTPLPPTIPADLMLEGFDTHAGANQGFDLPGWVINAGAGSAVDVDNTDVVRPDGLAECLKIASGSPFFDGYVHYLFPANNPLAYTTVYFRIPSTVPLTDGDLFDFIKYTDQVTWDKCARIFIGKSAGSLFFTCSFVFEGAEPFFAGPYPPAAYDTWYKIQFMYDAANKRAEFKLNDVSIWAPTWTGANPGGMGYVTIQTQNLASRAWTAYFDALAISSQGYSG